MTALDISVVMPQTVPLWLSSDAQPLNLAVGDEIVFNPLLHPHGWHGHFVNTEHAGSLSPGDVFMAKSNKVFQVEKKTDKGVKVKPVDKTSGVVKSGYTVIKHDQQIKVISKAKAVGSQHPIGELTAGTYVKTAKGKKFKISKHGKWTTVYPVNDKGDVNGKHTVLPKETVVTVHAPDESLAMTPEVVSKIDDIAKQAGVPAAEVQKISDLSDAQKAHDAADPWLQSKYGEWPTTIQDIHEAAAEEHANPAQASIKDMTPENQWKIAYATAVDDTVSVSGEELDQLSDAIHSAFVSPGSAQTPAEIASKHLEGKVTPAEVEAEFTKDSTGAYQKLLDNGVPEIAWSTAAYAAYANKHGEVYKAPGDAVTAYDAMHQDLAKALGKTPQPGEADKAAAAHKAADDWLQQVFSPEEANQIHNLAKKFKSDYPSQTWGNDYKAAYKIWHGSKGVEPGEVSTNDLGAVVDKAVAEAKPGSAPAPVPAAAAKKVQEVLPTKFAKATPKPYEDGVGQHTRVAIRTVYNIQDLTPDHYQLVRVTPEGHEQLLEKFSRGTGVTEMRKAAREHASAHEQITEEVSRVKENDMPIPDLQAGQVVNYRGNLYRIKEKLPDGNVRGSLLAGSGAGTPAFGNEWKHPYTFTQSQQKAMVAPPEGWEDMKAGDANTHKTVRESYATQIASATQAHRKNSLVKQVRGAAPNKYSPYLHAGWNPDQVIGATPKDALDALKVNDYLEIKPRQKGMVRTINRFGTRINLTVTDGKVSAVDQQKSTMADIGWKDTHDFKNQLQEVLDSGGDLNALDPSKGSSPEHTLSHVRNTLWDMAMGKKKGVTGAGDVKTDDDYRKELEAEGEVKPLEAFRPQALLEADPLKVAASAPKQMLYGKTDAHGKPHINAEGEYSIEVPEKLTDDQLGILYSTLKRRGMAQLALDTIDENPASAPNLRAAAIHIDQKLKNGDYDNLHPGGPDQPSTGDYIRNNMEYWKTNSKVRMAERADSINAATKALQTADVQDKIDKRRAAEGTVKEPTEDFDLPTWDNVDIQPQTMDEIEHLVTQDQLDRDVPAFYKGGVVEDSVLLHRSNQTDGKVPMALDGVTTQRMQMAGAELGKSHVDIAPVNKGTHKFTAGQSYYLDLGGGKSVEYLPHDQPGWKQGGAVTSQRGRLIVRGMAPAAAAAQLQQMGLIGDLEENVPFSSVQHASRYGALAPPMREYIRGEAKLPDYKQLAIHGISNPSALYTILQSGGLSSIADRFRRGQHTYGASPSGDMRSGIDHCVFTNYGSAAVGSMASVRILLRPSAYLQRDITLAPNDYGAAPTRYDNYRSFLHKLQGQVAEPKTNLYVPVSPAVRQKFLKEHQGGSAEFNMGPTIPIEQWETIGVSDASTRQQVEQQLKTMLAAGQIKRMPRVVSTAGLSQYQRASKPWAY